MTESAIPQHVGQFVVRHIESVAQLEVLLLLRGAPDKSWSAAEVSRALVTNADQSELWLADLEGRGLLAREDDTFRYSPATLELELAIDGLAASYATHRVSVISLIFSKPSGRLASFSDAFRIRRQD